MSAGDNGKPLAAPSEIYVYRPESHMWPAPANSFVLIDSRGGVLIDAGCGFRKCYEKIKDFLSALGLEPSDIHTLVLSHAHPDHIGAVPFLLAEEGCSPRVIAHTLEKPLARDNSLLNGTFDINYITEYYQEQYGGEPPAPVDIIDYFKTLCPMGEAEVTETVEEGDVLELAGRSFEVVHTPGHAPGHISLFDRDSATLLSGDVLGAVVPWYSPSGGGALGLLSSLDKIEALEPRMVHPSHGEDITDFAEAVAKTRECLDSRDRRILDMLAGGGMTLLEITDRMFPEAIRLFPGIQMTASHLTKLQDEGKVTRSGDNFTLGTDP
jgi:glyoxylase-like metal-dependent hydrolase (beta-lactamase superfamily II)